MADKIRRPREEIEPLANEVRKLLLQSRVAVEICGSLRRGLKTIADVDMVVAEPRKRIVEILKPLGKRAIIEPTKNGSGYTFQIDGVRFDILYATPENWGAATLHLTGNNLFNIVLRGKAKRQFCKLNQYGLFHGDEIIAGRTEAQVFGAIGLEYIPPEKRSLDPKRKSEWPFKVK